MENTSAKGKFKKCFVKSCGNTTYNTTNKHFFSVPTLRPFREYWLAAAQRDSATTHFTAFCCEDHFNLEQDAENWIRYKLTGNVRLKLKPYIAPHIFNFPGESSSKPPITNQAETSFVKPHVKNLAETPFLEPYITNLADTSFVEPHLPDLSEYQTHTADLMLKRKQAVQEALREIKRRKADERRFLKEQKFREIETIEERYVPIILRKARLNLFPKERLAGEEVTRGEPVVPDPSPNPEQFYKEPNREEVFIKEEVIYEDYEQSGWLSSVKQEVENCGDEFYIKEEPWDSHEVVN